VKTILLFCISLFSACSWLQETKKVAIRVDVLGKKNETVRYYHPVEGVYEIETHRFVNHRSIAPFFTNCVFIDPRLHLKDSLTHVQANSLRYLIDPSELLYVDWRLTADSSCEKQLTEFKEAGLEIREKKYQKLIKNYFRPFYFRKFEVTNREYREFVYWVRDSIFKEAIYASSEFTDEEVFDMLNATPKSVYFDETEIKWKTVDLSNRTENRKFFSFKSDYDIWKELVHERLVPVLSEFYLKPDERWYKRREPDVKKLVYRYYDLDLNGLNDAKDSAKLKQDSTRNSNIRSHQDYSRFIRYYELAVYPDTLGWVRDTRYTFNDPFSNIYFWHPAYDRYPVNGVSWDQAKAFCHWKEQQFYAKYPVWGEQFTFDLPTPQEFEWAICEPHEMQMASVIQDDELVTDLLLDWSTGDYGQFHELLLKNVIGYTEKVDLPFDANDVSKLKDMKKWLLKKQKKSPHSASIKELSYYVSMMRSTQNYLISDVRFLSNNLSEWMNADFKSNYEKLFEAYQNYNCFADISYCENQRNVDLINVMENDSTGKLIMGANWFDERYENALGINIGGLYAKTFRDKSKSFSTVGFRYVIRLKT
jgi:hypothetical protein